MQSVHRQLGKLMKRSADESKVSVLLKDFDQADKLLTRVSLPVPAINIVLSCKSRTVRQARNTVFTC